MGLQYLRPKQKLKIAVTAQSSAKKIPISLPERFIANCRCPLAAQTKLVPSVVKSLGLAAGLLLLLLAFAWPYLLIIGNLVVWDTYYRFVPVYSASYVIPGNDMRVKLELWSTTSENGTHLTLNSSRGSVKYQLYSDDWAHRARTSLYLAGQGNFAVVGPDDGIVVSDELKISRAFRVPSEHWIYLGAFDFSPPLVKGEDRSLGFIPASEQMECIPTNSDRRYDHEPRNSARKSRCP